jgi:hypothetical protein
VTLLGFSRWIFLVIVYGLSALVFLGPRPALLTSAGDPA